eukprot:948677_1
MMKLLILVSILLSTKGEPLTCGGFENCVNYYDGCNTCYCSLDASNVMSTACTEMACSPDGYHGLAKCTKCTDDYTLIDGKCDGSASTIPSCGGIDYCMSFSPDGCNTCGCSATDAVTMCTLMYCGPDTINTCLVCIDGYEVQDGVCVPNACNLPKKVGPCKAAFPRYYYNNKTETCDAFTYGGCQGNDNNFETKEICLEFAGKCRANTDAKTTEAPTCGNVEQCNLFTDGCTTCVCSSNGELMCDDVECTTSNTALECIGCNDGFYPLDGQCVERTECGGFTNCVNYFDGCNWCSCGGLLSTCTLKYCEVDQDAECTECEEGYVLMDGQCMDTVCELGPETGPCDAVFSRYYYSSDMGECVLFSYGGCEGNDNNFETEMECMERCVAIALTQNNNGMAAMAVSYTTLLSLLHFIFL